MQTMEAEREEKVSLVQVSDDEDTVDITASGDEEWAATYKVNGTEIKF